MQVAYGGIDWVPNDFVVLRVAYSFRRRWPFCQLQSFCQFLVVGGWIAQERHSSRSGEDILRLSGAGPLRFAPFWKQTRTWYAVTLLY